MYLWVIVKLYYVGKFCLFVVSLTAQFCERIAFTDGLWCIHLCFWILECELFHKEYLFLLFVLNILQ